MYSTECWLNRERTSSRFTVGSPCSSMASSLPPRIVLAISPRRVTSWTRSLAVSEHRSSVPSTGRIVKRLLFRDRFIEVQNGPAHHGPRCHLVQVHIRRDVLEVGHGDVHGRAGALLEILVL